ncbi:biopolymer transport protein ExbB [Modicisalibacter ilicicola DSM 19980]|uniref:Biopolymer transport protein ExbB n=1 Tax=Modicisalibacter ilicicola DSM 19980 TaxID=1121942 RepID=A0A1M5CKL2_9GAMM|nr:MotA/TolQ/ExbB proton channel family protein [Halomonas ilicicola]SHF55241.1 biopolymer transport protein ExbB [Halomonas ilicicola DSM 19980]
MIGRHLLLRGCLAALWLASPLAFAQSVEPAPSFGAEREATAAKDVVRLATLADDPEALNAALESARQRLSDARDRRENLEERHADQRSRLEELATRQEAQRSEDLDAVTGVLEEHIGTLRDDLADSWLTLGDLGLPERADAQEPLTPQRLETVADTLMALTRESGRISRLSVPVAGVGGEVTNRELIRLGDMMAFSDGHWLRQESGDMPPAMIGHTPDKAQQALSAFARGEQGALTLDPTRGTLIDAMAQQPSLLDRFHQGGAVGYVVVALGGLGLLVALVQYLYLLIVTLRLRRQLGQLDRLRRDNPLGRVLGKFQALHPGLAPEALEARLDEALLAEYPRLERGQPLVKLLAAVAPLLGLLGTVTGMIVTFQAITVFGTGDPQLMAGGISQALVTTVLGLITAVPLLFAHTALASRSRGLTGVLEGQASAFLAEHLETRPSHDTRHEVQHASSLA